MLYYLFNWLNEHYDIPGAGLFQFISFRTGMAVILSLFLTTIYGSRLIKMLRAKQVGEPVRNLGLEGQMQKQGTPTMGGLIILLGILGPTLLFARLENIYIILILVTTVWMGTIGFIDDYIKVFKRDKEGLAGRFKIMGQVGLALIIGWTMYFHPDIVVREQVTGNSEEELAQKALEKKMKFWKNLPVLEFKKKAYEYLMRRGFEYEVVKEVIENLIKKM